MENKYSEKLSLLADMVAFATVDGELHDKEYRFLMLITCELKVKNEDFLQLFHNETKHETIKNEFDRIQQFYRLALLMHYDGILHDREQIAIHEIGLHFGLSPFAVKRVLKAMEQSDNNMVSPQYLLEVFQEQLN